MTKEVKRQARVVDQMLSMHSALRDRYSRKAIGLTIVILGLSVVLCTITFLPDSALEPLGISAAANRFIIGGLGSLVFFLALMELFLRWQAISVHHSDAAEELAKLKLQYRTALSRGEVDPGACEMLKQAYEACMEKLPPIPERLFPSLKSHHLRKIRLSQMIDSNPGSPVWFLRLRLLWAGIRGKKDEEGAD